MDISKLNVCTCSHKRRVHDGGKNTVDKRVHECREPGCKCIKYSRSDKSMTPQELKETLHVVGFASLAIMMAVVLYGVLTLTVSTVYEDSVSLTPEEMAFVSLAVEYAVNGTAFPNDMMQTLEIEDDSNLREIADVSTLIMLDSHEEMVHTSFILVSVFIGYGIFIIGVFTINNKAREDEALL